MNESGYRFGVGVLVLASVVIGVLLVAFFGAIPNLFADRYSVIINFDETPGVSVDTPVRKNGVRIGRVVDVNLLPGDRGVNVELELDTDYEIKYSERIVIKSNSIITGDAVIEFMKPTARSLLTRFDGAAGQPRDNVLQPAEKAFADENSLQEGDALAGGEVQPDPMEVVVGIQADFGNALGAIEKASLKVEQLAGNFQQVLGGGQEDMSEVVASTKRAIENFNTTSEAIRRVIDQVERAELPDRIAAALNRLPAVLEEAETTIAQTRKTIATFDEVGVSFAEVGDTANQFLENVRDISEPLSEQSDRIVGNVLNTVEDVRAAIADVRRVANNLNGLTTNLRQFSDRVNNSHGTVARLIDDDRAYIQLVRTLQNIEMTTQDINRITQKLRPIVDDVRVFTDKAARDPAQFGVRGVLSSRPLGAGIK